MRVEHSELRVSFDTRTTSFLVSTCSSSSVGRVIEHDVAAKSSESRTALQKALITRCCYMIIGLRQEGAVSIRPKKRTSMWRDSNEGGRRKGDPSEASSQLREIASRAAISIVSLVDHSSSTVRTRVQSE